ncbi:MULTISPECIES: histidine phosphatase family protein [Arthrobacter]|uniref:histidine phosphatase family protein n=1 Tax=Arthrobacter TaxID=1663 RepID=UPI001D141FC1|nr:MULTISPECIES: histidine phosphatase family protein [Arthrobacter]MCC3281268.1 histidine phosphatase family protein [Arthrobacter caoxuetaonis]MCC9192557.1 histidine phosphatase family protein [Arthrobacter sp. zg-Y916]
MRLILVRHGQTPSNIERLLDTDAPGPGLTELGMAQAAALPKALGHEQVSAVYASNLIRTQLTAQPLADALAQPIEVREGLREVSAGTLEMRGDPESIQAYLRTVYAWVNGDLSVQMPGGPDGAETIGRFDEVVAELQRAGHGVPVVFSHGAIIRAWATLRARNVGPDFIVQNSLSNTGIVVLETTPRPEARGHAWELLTWQGEAVGGAALQDPETDGPAADDVELAP